MATAYRLQGRNGEAERLLRDRLLQTRGQEARAGSEIAVIHAQLGLLNLAQARYADAETELTLALDLRKQMYGDAHPQVGQVLDYLGRLSAVQGSTDAAVSYFERALAMQELPDRLERYAAVLRLAGRNSDASRAEMRAAALRDALGRS
jgi:serine/threonine-protein kinase